MEKLFLITIHHAYARIGAFFFIFFIIAAIGCKPHKNGDLTDTIDSEKFDFQALNKFVSQDTPPRGTLKLPGLTVRYLRQGKTTDEPVKELNPETFPKNLKELGMPNELTSEKYHFNGQKWILFNGKNNQEFEVEISDDLIKSFFKLHDTKKSRKGDRGKEFKDSIETGFLNIPKLNQFEAEKEGYKVVLTGLSRGVDSRTRYSTFSTRYPWRTISQFSNGCSGTLIGPRHVLTAAHCIYNRDSDSWNTFTVRPGRSSGNASPFGDAVMPTAGEFNWYFTPEAFRDPGADSEDFSPDDWGLIIIPERLGGSEGGAGWMGYDAQPGSELGNLVHFNQGYPCCGCSIPPPGCVSLNLYGDINDCELISYTSPDPSGWNRVIRHSCDASDGHSGSPIYYLAEDADSQTWPYITMIHFWSYRSSSTFNSGARRLTPNDVGIIDFFRDWAE